LHRHGGPYAELEGDLDLLLRLEPDVEELSVLRNHILLHHAPLREDLYIYIYNKKMPPLVSFQRATSICGLKLLV
jgi:hypothetical protein